MRAVEYGWREGWRPRGGLSAEVVGAELEDVRDKHGAITAEIYVEEATRKRSPLHQTLEWDDATAAHQYRLEQARHVIQSIVIRRVDGEDSPPVRAFVHLREKESESSYVPAVVARDDPFLRKQMLDQAATELASWKRRYQNLKEFAGVVAAIEKATEKVA